jgi:hypothetical protein
VDLALDPSELEGMSEQALRDKYESTRRSTGGAGQGAREDFGDFVAEELAKRRAPLRDNHCSALIERCMQANGHLDLARSANGGRNSSSKLAGCTAVAHVVARPPLPAFRLDTLERHQCCTSGRVLCWCHNETALNA